MFASLNRGRLPQAPGADLASRHAHGLDAGSGQVAPDAPIQHTNPDAGGAVEVLGRHVVQTNPQPVDGLRPIPGVVTRDLFGGVRVSRRTNLLRESPPFMGGHVELVGRRPVVIAPAQQISAEPTPTLPSLRVPPVSDPYGRMCANAAATAARNGRTA